MRSAIPLDIAKIGNPRYKVFYTLFGCQPNWEYLSFIADMRRRYCIENHISSTAPICDHDDFTSFIEKTASCYKLTPPRPTRKSKEPMPEELECDMSNEDLQFIVDLDDVEENQLNDVEVQDVQTQLGI